MYIFVVSVVVAVVVVVGGFDLLFFICLSIYLCFFVAVGKGYLGWFIFRCFLLCFATVYIILESVDVSFLILLFSLLLL